MRLLGGWLIAMALCAAGCGGDEASGDRPDRSRTPAEARKCLEADGFQTEPATIGAREDPDKPDAGLLAYLSGSHAEIAFYGDVARAKRSERGAREGAKRSGGDVERIGRATIFWLAKPSPDAADRLERCVTAP